jgi:hypothetical protein
LLLRISLDAVALHSTRRNMKGMKKKREKRMSESFRMSRFYGSCSSDKTDDGASSKRARYLWKGQVVGYESNETRRIKTRCK